MASGKRASMREGPLAQLFRKTEEDDARPDQKPQPRKEEEPKLGRPLPEGGPAPQVTRHVPEPQGNTERHGQTERMTEAARRADVRVAPDRPTEPVLRVVGVGGAGVNAVNRMIEAEVEGVEFLAVNTDVQSLEGSGATTRLHIGSDATRGLGSGSNPDLGRAAAVEDYDEIKSHLKGADMVFIAAGSGGGTGTGAAPVVARIAREVGALTVGIVTKPF